MLSISRLTVFWTGGESKICWFVEYAVGNILYENAIVKSWIGKANQEPFSIRCSGSPTIDQRTEKPNQFVLFSRWTFLGQSIMVAFNFQGQTLLTSTTWYSSMSFLPSLRITSRLDAYQLVQGEISKSFDSLLQQIFFHTSVRLLLSLKVSNMQSSSNLPATWKEFDTTGLTMDEPMKGNDGDTRVMEVRSMLEDLRQSAKYLICEVDEQQQSGTYTCGFGEQPRQRQTKTTNTKGKKAGAIRDGSNQYITAWMHPFCYGRAGIASKTHRFVA